MHVGVSHFVIVTIFIPCLAILGYVASFALIRYRIVDAHGEDDAKAGGTLFLNLGAAQPAQRVSRRIVLEPVHPLSLLVNFMRRPERLGPGFFPGCRRSSERAPLSLLTRCYYTTLCLTAAGFFLAIIGILAYMWAGLRVPVGVFSTICLSVGVGAGVWAIAL